VARSLKKVFLSSTGRDLQEYRDEVALAINRIEGFHCVRMEDFGARNRSPKDHCLWVVQTCDVYVGLFGRFYGSLVPGETFSFTEMEYATAVELDLPRFVFLASKDFPQPESLWEEARKTRKARDRFHATAKADRLASSFDFGATAPHELATQVTAALANLRLERKRKAPKAQTTSGAPAKAIHDLAQSERTYLAYLSDRYQYLDFRGMGVTDKLPVRLALRELYVPLKARPVLLEGDKGGMEGLHLAGRRMTKEEREEAGGIGQPVPVLQLLQKEAGLVLLGDPGAGKSTFLKYLALSLAAGDGESLGLAGRLPFLVPIARYAEALAKGNVRLDHFVESDFRERVGDLALGGLLAAALEEGRALLLLDGLDEVRDRALQKRVVARVQDFFSLHARDGNKFVITSRLVGYREVRPTVKGLIEATLLDFDQEEIEAFLANWFVVQERAALGDTQAAAGSAERQRRELLEALARNWEVRALAANPLLLTILALMKRQGMNLPEQRAKLYDNYVQTLLETWNTARSLREEPVVERSAADLLKVLAPLALWIHESSPGVGLVRRTELLARLEAMYRDHSGIADPEAARAAAESFLRDVDDSCLLLERGSGHYGFIHLTFLEYLAGYALAKLDQCGTEALLQAIFPRVGEPTWREVILLAISHLSVVELREISAGRLLVELVEKEPGPPGEAVVLAGLALADLGPKGVPPEVREKVVAALQATLRDYKKVEPVRRVAAGEALAAVGDPRSEVMTIEGMQFCWVPPGPFLMGSNKEETASYTDEEPQHEVEIPYGYWIGRFPITVMQFAEYCRRDEVPGGKERVLVGPANAPMVEVAWHEAIAFCHWLNEQRSGTGWLAAGWRVTLTSEAEWEKAARGGLRLASSPVVARWNEFSAPGPSPALANPRPDRSYPWGHKKAGDRANFDETGIGRRNAVGCFLGGASPVGCEELSGNVWEWTRSLWGKNPGEPEFGYPYESTDGREDLEAGDDVARVLRGGSFFYNSRLVRCAARNRGIPVDRYVDLGFRVVLRQFFPEP
jgi:formylglycine-generating enzyme required for sulfatase activity